MKNFVGAMNRNFRGRLFRLIVVNTPAVIRGVWTIIYNWLDKFIQQKITVTDEPSNALLPYIDENDLEEKYGGKAPERTVFWPI
jgi:hypothetical protein